MTTAGRIVGVSLFLAGIAGGRFLSFGSGENKQSGSASQEMVEPSKLHNDFIHLNSLHELRAAWEGADEEARAALIERAGNIFPPDAIRFLLLDKYRGSSRNPELGKRVAFEWSRSTQHDEVSSTACRAFLISLSRENLDELKDDFLLVPPGLPDEESLLAYWKTTPPALNKALRPTVFGRLFWKDPARALLEMKAIPVRERDPIWKQAQDTSGHPAEILQALENQHDVVAPGIYISKLISELAHQNQNFAAFQAKVMEMPPGIKKERYSAPVVGIIAEYAPDCALAWLETHAPNAKNRYIAGRSWDILDIPRSFAVTSGRILPGERTMDMRADNRLDDTYSKNGDFLRMDMRDYASYSWDTAVALTLNTPSLAVRFACVCGLACAVDFEIYKAGLVPSLDKLSRIITQARLQPRALQIGVDFSGIKASDRSAVLGWLGRQPSIVQATLTQPLAYALIKPGQDTPAEQAAFLAELQPGPPRTKLIIQLVYQWATLAPQEAAAFSLSLPPGTDRDYAILNTVIAWNLTDPPAALAWLQQIPDSPVKDRALEILK